MTIIMHVILAMRISELFHLPINPAALDINHDAAPHSKIHQAPLKPKKSKVQ